jgi:hypothetical protein
MPPLAAKSFDARCEIDGRDCVLLPCRIDGRSFQAATLRLLAVVGDDEQLIAVAVLEAELQRLVGEDGSDVGEKAMAERDEAKGDVGADDRDGE